MAKALAVLVTNATGARMLHLLEDNCSDADGAGIIFMTGGGLAITGAVYMFILASRITTLYSLI